MKNDLETIDSPVDALHADTHFTIIKPASGWRLLDLNELYAFRELLFFLTWRDIKVRYKQTVLGFVWAIANPLAQMIVFTLIFGYVMQIQNLGKFDSITSYALFVFSGIIPWQFFVRGLGGGSSSLVSSASLVTKIYFPRIIIPISSIGANLVDFCIGILLLLPLLLWTGSGFGWTLLLFPVLVILLMLASLSVGIFLSAITVIYRDVRYIVPFLGQMWMYLTPVLYPVTIIPERFRWILKLNPMTGILDGFRSCLLGSPMDYQSLVVATGMILVSFVVSIICFRRVETLFADIV